jgi:hypothetical protein
MRPSCLVAVVGPVLSVTRQLPFRFDEPPGREKNLFMKMKPMIVAALAAGLLSSGAGIAFADPPPAPDPNGPKCWGSTDSGYMHWGYVPCGWTYSDSGGWQQLPAPPP